MCTLWGKERKTQWYEIMENLLSGIDKPTVKADTRFAGTRADKNVTGSFTFVNSENFSISVKSFNGLVRLFQSSNIINHLENSIKI